MLVERYIYIDGNRKRRVASVGNIGKLPSRVAAALVWRGALSSSPSPPNKYTEQLSYYLRTVAT